MLNWVVEIVIKNVFLFLAARASSLFIFLYVTNPTIRLNFMCIIALAWKWRSLPYGHLFVVSHKVLILSEHVILVAQIRWLRQGLISVWQRRWSTKRYTFNTIINLHCIILEAGWGSLTDDVLRTTRKVLLLMVMSRIIHHGTLHIRIHLKVPLINLIL